MREPTRTDALALGLDAGGSQTRWALQRADGAQVADGSVAGLSAMQLATPDGQRAIDATLGALARALEPHGKVHMVHAGVTGYGGIATPHPGPGLAARVAETLALPVEAVQLTSDIALVCAACFAPGHGIALYAGTGSVAAHVDQQGVMHRAGGRGALIDDAGGGHWIAREALRHIWRAEDAAPGAWRESAMAKAVLERVGGTDWAHTRSLVSRADRGEIGRLALAVAESANGAHPDAAALALLQRAGHELARLAQCLIQRLGAQPVALAGRAFDLHPTVAATTAALLPGVPVSRFATDGLARAAAAIAARRLPPPMSSVH